MSVAYLAPEVQFEPERRVVRARFRVRNDSSETWSPAEGFALGYHLFDADTGTLIVDGARVLPAGEIAPGQSAPFELNFEFPPEDGNYRALISPLREHICWHYEQGCPFLLVEGATNRGVSRFRPARVSTLRELRRRDALRSVGRPLLYPFSTVWRNRGLIRVMVRRDILGRYRGSFGGIFWTVINPLLLMLTYFFVFGIVLRTRIGADPGRAGFALYFLAGMLPWLAFSEAAGRAPGVILEHRNFVKKLVFAVETLPVNLVISGLVSELFAVVLFCVFLALARGGLPASVLWLPVLLIPQLLFTAGLSWFLAALGVFVRDLGQAVGYLLTFWFFLTPICDPRESLPAAAWPLLSRNPVFVLVDGYRAILLDHRAPAFSPLWKLYVLAAVVFVLGHAFFYRLRKSFPDLL